MSDNLELSCFANPAYCRRRATIFETDSPSRVASRPKIFRGRISESALSSSRWGSTTTTTTTTMTRSCKQWFDCSHCAARIWKSRAAFVERKRKGGGGRDGMWRRSWGIVRRGTRISVHWHTRTADHCRFRKSVFSCANLYGERGREILRPVHGLRQQSTVVSCLQRLATKCTTMTIAWSSMTARQILRRNLPGECQVY